ncbi:hypothetical protein [Magnetococcus sp. PR-3]|uniref:hypothetical protein n=1 Tax=Magnetococcus sp. PR-3 TaxID=3120355 RepID=UPI002FCE2D33
MSESPEASTEVPPVQIDTDTLVSSDPPVRSAWHLLAIATAEIVFFFALCLAVDLFFFSGDRFITLAPHPFWIIILLTCVQYGTGAGLIAATLGTIALLAGNMPPHPFEQDIFSYLFEVGIRPLMWLTTAVILGEMSQRHIHARRELDRKLQEAESRAADISHSFRTIEQQKQNLEVRLAGQMRTVISTYEAARAIEKLEPAMVLFGVADMIRSMIAPAKFSLFTLSGDRMQAGIQQGWGAEDHYARLFNTHDQLFQEIVGRKQILCIANAEDEKILAGEGVLAGPIRDGQGGRIWGMLKIESLGFMELNLTTLENFRVVCEWIGMVYHNARQFQDARSNSLFNDDKTLFSDAFFGWQSDFLARLAKRIGIDACIITVQLSNPGQLSDEVVKEFPEMLNKMTEQALRTTDLPFEQQKRTDEVAILLPGTPMDHTGRVVEKIEQFFEEHYPDLNKKLHFNITVQDLTGQESP